MKILLLALLIAQASPQPAKIVDVPMRLQPVPEIRLRVGRGVLGATVEPHNGWVGQIYPGSDLNRYPWIRRGDYFVLPVPQGRIGEIVSVGVIKQGRRFDIQVELRDPRLFEGAPSIDRINNQSYYTQVRRGNGY